jgi:N-methylhydantoinase B/oxoprolinase/acetone carboxylase alpha subunit
MDDVVTEYKPPPPPSDDGKRRGRRPRGPRASTNAERQARYRRGDAETRVKALAHAAMIERDVKDVIDRYGIAAVRKAFKASARRGRQRSRHVTGRLMAEAEADLEYRRRVREGLLAAFYKLAATVSEMDDETWERWAGLLEVLRKGVYTIADALIE